MNRTAVTTILQRDLRVVARSRAVSLPILLLPIVFFVLAPALLTLGAAAIGDDVAEFEELLAMMPEALRRDLAGLDPSGQVIVWGLEYVFATFFLIVPLDDVGRDRRRQLRRREGAQDARGLGVHPDE